MDASHYSCEDGDETAEFEAHDAAVVDVAKLFSLVESYNFKSMLSLWLLTGRPLLL